MTETASFAGRLADLVLDPWSLAGIVLAGMALTAILAARRRGPRAPAPAPDRFAPTQPIPLLETPMAPVLAAPRRTERAPSGWPGLICGLAFAAIGVVAFGGLIVLGMRAAGGADAPASAASAGRGNQVAGRAADSVGPAGCRPGLDGHAASYTHCGAGVPVRYEVLGLAVDGARLTDAAWSGAGRPFVLTAPARPAPFTLDGDASLLAAPGSDLGDYDAYVAVGYADAGEGADAAIRAEARGLALAELALRTTQGGNPRDCRSDATVHAVSLGAGGDGPAPAPLLIGVRVEDRVNRPRGGAGGLDAMLDGLFAGEGAAITGLPVEAYGPWRVLSSERACRRSPV